MGLPDIFDVLTLLGIGLMAYGAERIWPGLGFLVAGYSVYLIGLRGPSSPTAPPIGPLGGN